MFLWITLPSVLTVRGSWSSYDEAGMLKEIGVTDVGNMYAQMCSLVTRGGFDFAEALTYFTSNVAKSTGDREEKKGHIMAGADADILLIKDDLTLDTVIAGGRKMMEGGTLLVRGTYEHD